MRKKLLIIGDGGLAREIAIMVQSINQIYSLWEFEGYICKKGGKVGLDLGLGLIVGDDEWLLDLEAEYDIIIGLGYPQIRAKVISKILKKRNFAFPNLIHPNAMVNLNTVLLGEGNIISCGCIFTCDIKVGNFNFFNLNTIIGHDVVIGNYNVINPCANVSGKVVLQDRIMVGCGSQILERVSICSDSTIGLGSVVIKNISLPATYFGIPAKKIF